MVHAIRDQPKGIAQSRLRNFLFNRGYFLKEQRKEIESWKAQKLAKYFPESVNDTVACLNLEQEYVFIQIFLLMQYK